MAQTILAIMRQKRNSYEWFQNNNPTLADGQIGVVNSGQYKNCFKIGDGVAAWNSLSWATDYTILFNKPSINKVKLSGDTSLVKLGIASIDALDAEETTRTQAVAALQTALDAEETARTQADAALQTALDAEETTRTQADAALQTALDAEETPRTQADAALQTAL
ncbi:MAG: hypothetical protein LBH85_01650, partial [Treponema sp.]|nr:hypothetical protein [Treponema sp.]